MGIMQINSFAITNMTRGAHNKFNIDVNNAIIQATAAALRVDCLLYTSPSPRDTERSRMPSSA